MGTVKREARLSGMLLARKGTAKPAHIDHHLNVQVMDQFKQATEKKTPASDIKQHQPLDQNERLADAVKEINNLTQRQYNKAVQSVSKKPQALERVAEPVKAEVVKDDKTVSAESAKASKRIAMTLRMEHEEHLKLKIFAAHTRKSCQEVISEALQKYLCQSEKMCNMSDCNCLK
ncbi:hypothetical protein [Pseudemcibacter aquimaris]|uniref:hypothetical protein n=1 Tax=Pseudemcibacter aquimaris TaxID=2857064 RepID=UPI00201327A6|nr:hypothetical protein [Pseudemcibacter aquimaris]MCC3860376.1 hypothetical protein [Pseudemcibacter aquimaris]WDU57702.1 hypothetical protein KW060_10895 [Pseudemcibacter aquimaris]